MRGGDQWEFGEFIADARQQQLLCNGRAVPLTRRAFTVLTTLLTRPGQLFTKHELFETVWAGRVVTDAALSRSIHELRTALGDDASTPRFIATAHGLGFRFVAPVSVGAQSARVATPAPTREARVVGRDAELRQLAEALADARDGRRRLVFVTGEAGIGKTALVEAFLEREAARDLWIGQGRCIEQYGAGEAFLPLLESLEQLARRADSETFRGVLQSYAPAWLAQLPWLASAARTAAPPGHGDDDATPQRMLRELAQALEVLAAERPIVLWLEDLHWSDPSSLAALSFLAGRRDRARLLVIASFRPSDARASASPLHSLALQLAQRGQASEIALGALDAAAVKRLLALRLGDGGQPALLDDVAAFVHRRSEGHALFAVTLVDDLLRRGELRREDDRWTLKGSLAALGGVLPESLRLLVHEQYERLPDDDRRVVEAAAVAGAGFCAAAVAAALQADPGEIEDRCARLASQGRFLHAHPATAVWPDGTVSASFGFLHALYCEGIVERVPAGRRVEWQRRIGLRQEQGYGTQCGAIAAELAMRFEAARDLERSVRYLQLAGGGALVRCAYPECIASLRRGLALVPKLPEARRPRQELELLLPLGVALMATKGYADDEVESTYARARELCLVCARPGDLERVLRGQWNVAFIRADLAGARSLAEHLLEHARARDDDELAFDAHSKLGYNHLHEGELSAARLHLERALALSGDGQPARLRLAPRIAISLSWALWHAGLAAQARQRAEDAVTLARDVRSPQSSAFALGYGMFLHVLRGDLARARELAPELTSITAEHGLIYWRHLSDFVHGMITARQGEPALGAAMMRRGMLAMRAGGAKVGMPYLQCLIAEAHVAASQLDEARAALDDAAGIVAATGNALYVAEAARIEGDLELARDGGADARRRADAHYRSALVLARRHGARMFELRAATSLARSLAAEARLRRALDALAPVHARLIECSDAADWLAATALLRELHERAGVRSAST